MRLASSPIDLDSLFARRILMVTGKGGIGKTLVTAALAIAAAARGKRVCVIESAAHDQQAPLFGLEPVGHNLTAATPQISVINLNSQDNFRDFVIIQLGHRNLFEKIFTKSIVSSFIQMIPGIPELTLLGRLFYFAELCQSPRFDLILLDGYASGHFLSLLKTPDAILASGLVGPVVEETRRVREYIHNPAKTGIIQVVNARELVVGESLEFLRRFHSETELSFAHLIMNRALVPKLSAEHRPAADDGLGQYLWQRQSEFDSNLALWEAGLAAMQWPGPPPSISILPEVGLVPEPLRTSWVEQWFSATAEGLA